MYKKSCPVNRHWLYLIVVVIRSASIGASNVLIPGLIWNVAVYSPALPHVFDTATNLYQVVVNEPNTTFDPAAGTLYKFLTAINVLG